MVLWINTMVYLYLAYHLSLSLIQSTWRYPEQIAKLSRVLNNSNKLVSGMSNVRLRGARFSTVVRAFTHDAMCCRIDPSW